VRSISEKSFSVFFHDIPAKDSRYDIEKDVMERKLVLLDRDTDEEMKEANHEENITPHNESDASFEEILESL